MTRAVIMRGWGAPEVLVPGEVDVPSPAAGEIAIDVQFAGVGPTDLAIRAGHLKGAFGSAPGSVLGFEVAGVVRAVGGGVSDVRAGDAVAAFLPELGGYAEQVLARHWVRRPDGVGAQDAAALPAAAEAAARVVEETQVSATDTVLIVGAAGSVGLLATQLAIGRGARVIAAVRTDDAGLLQGLGAVPVRYGPDLAGAVRERARAVDVVIDAAGKGVLAAAVDLAGGSERVVTLSDPHAADFGVRLSGPEEKLIGQRLESVMRLLAAGQLRLRTQEVAPLGGAADVHRGMESGRLRAKVLLAATNFS